MIDPQENLRRRLCAQIKKIETDRFDEGIRRGHDPRLDEDYDLAWTQSKKAIEFAKEWDESLCKSCRNACICGFKTAKKCPHHDPL